MNSSRPQSSRQRVRDPGQTSSGDAVVLLEISVESLSLQDAKNSDVDDDQRIAYVRAVCNFRRLVLEDFDRTLTNVRRSLTQSYDCRSVRSAAPGDASSSFENCAPGDEGSVVLELRQPRARMVSLQCDLSSGHLNRELQRLLATDAVVSALGLTEMTLNTDIRTIN